MIALNKRPDKDFTVLNFSDTQLSNGEWQEGHKNRRILEQTISEAIKGANPDLITLSGDLAWAGHDQAYGMLATFIDSFNIPWAPIWGNHDNQNGAEYIDNLASRFMEYSNCIYEKGDPQLGNGNYIICIKENEKPVEAIFMLDSHDREPYVNAKGEEELVWGRLNDLQLEWIKKESEDLQAKGCLDATMILHIPIYAYRKASAAAFKSSVDRRTVSLKDAENGSCWNEGYIESTGVEYDSIGSYPEEDNAFDAIKEAKIIKRLLAGHDHTNNWMIKYDGIDLMYSLKTGAGCYWNPVLNGGTVLKINKNGVYKVYHEYVDVSSLLAGKQSTKQV